MTIQPNANAPIIWEYFRKKGFTELACSGIIGNLYVESFLRPDNLQNSYEKKLGMTDAQYVAKVDSCEYTNFVRDSAGFGLAQWTYWSRKEALLNFARHAGKSIADLSMQLDFLYFELTTKYPTVIEELKRSKTVLEASNAMMLGYERPKDQSIANQNRRSVYCNEFYELYRKKAIEVKDVKIMLDAGHYGKANQSPVVNEYWESKAMWTLHLLQKKYLEAFGFIVGTTRPTQSKDLSLSARGKKAKGYNLFLSDHSNACGTESVRRVAGIYMAGNDAISLESKKVADVLAKATAMTMGVTYANYSKDAGYDRNKDGIRGNDEYYGVLDGAESVGVAGLILENSFHTNAESARWLLNESNLDKLAYAQAKALAEYYGIEKAPEAPKDEPKDYIKRVKVKVYALNIRKGAGVWNQVCGVITDDKELILKYPNYYYPKGVFTITEIKGEWGKLKSGIGWINTASAYCEEV